MYSNILIYSYIVSRYSVSIFTHEHTESIRKHMINLLIDPTELTDFKL
jgi:hypothetical protein